MFFHICVCVSQKYICLFDILLNIMPVAAYPTTNCLFFPSLSMLLICIMCGITVHLFLLSESILVCDSTIVYLSIMSLLDIEDVFSFFATISTSFCSID